MAPTSLGADKPWRRQALAPTSLGADKPWRPTAAESARCVGWSRAGKGLLRRTPDVDQARAENERNALRPKGTSAQRASAWCYPCVELSYDQLTGVSVNSDACLADRFRHLSKKCCSRRE